MRRFAVLMVVFSLIGSSLSFGQTFNVSNEQEFQNALNQAISNGEDDTIILSSGTYKLTQNGNNKFMYYSPSGTDGKSLTIEGAGIDKTIIDGSGVSGTTLLYIASFQGGNFTIRNLTFKGGNTTFTDLYGTWNFSGGGVYLVTDGDILIENVKFTGNTVGNNGYGGGAYINSISGDITVRNCIFYKNLGQTGAGIYINNGQAYGPASNGNMYIYNNVFFENGGYQGAGFYINANTTGKINIINNTVVRNVIFPNAPQATAYGAGGYIFINQNNLTLNVYNNIFWENDNKAKSTLKVNDLLLDNSNGNPIFNLFNNNIYPSSLDSFSVMKSTYINYGNNIYENPQFVDVSNLDFSLKSSSPMIDKGENSVVNFNTDFAGNSRIVDGNSDGTAIVDIGALEYVPQNSGNNGGSGNGNGSGSGGGNQTYSTITLNVIKPTNGTVKVGSDINCGTNGNICSKNYSTGTQITLEAIADNGYKFDGWNDGCAVLCNGVDNPCTLTLPNDTDTLTCSAVFSAISQNQVNLQISIVGDGKVDITGAITQSCTDKNNGCTYSLASGSNVTLKAVADSGYKFKQWNGDCSNCQTDSCQITAQNNVSCEAIFEQETNTNTNSGSGGSGGGGCSFGSVPSLQIILLLFVVVAVRKVRNKLKI